MKTGGQLQTRALSVAIDSATLLDGIDLPLEEGAFTAILGPNGAGKTTLLRVLAGLQAPSEGQVLLDGAPLSARTELDRARQIALIGHEAPPPFPWTVLELVLMGRAPHLGLRGLEAEDDLELARRALARVAMEGFASRLVETLSAGERQRVMWARALCQTPRVLLLDEPTSHQDPGRALALMELLRTLTDEGCTVISVLHDVSLAARFAHHAVLLREGRVAGHGAVDETLTPELLSAVYDTRCRRSGETLVFDPPAVTP